MRLLDLKELLRVEYVLNERAMLDGFEWRWKHPLRVLGGNMDVEKVTTAVIEDYKARRRAEGAAPSTINNELSLIRRAFNIALFQERLGRAPKVRAFACRNARQGFVDPPAFGRLVRTLEVLDPPVAEVIRWLYLLGWRREEALGLAWAEVDREARTIRLPAARTKNREAKAIRVGGEVLEILRRRDADRDGPLVFHRAGSPIVEFRGTWKRATEALGRPELRPHDLRRSFARNGILAGLPMKLVMEIGGWKTMSVFLRYCIIDEDLVEQGIERVSSFVRAKQDASEKARLRHRDGGPACLSLPSWLRNTLRSLNGNQRAETLELLRSYGNGSGGEESP